MLNEGQPTFNSVSILKYMKLGSKEFKNIFNTGDKTISTLIETLIHLRGNS